MGRIRRGTLKINEKTYPIFEGLNTIGRNQNASIKIKNLNISHNHAIITVFENKHFVSEVTSQNGTYVNEKKILPLLLYEIQDNSVIRFADLLGIYSTTTEETCDNTENYFDSFLNAETQQLNETDIKENDPYNINDMPTQVMDITENSASTGSPKTDHVQSEHIYMEEIDDFQINNFNRPLDTQDTSSKKVHIQGDLSIHDMATQVQDIQEVFCENVDSLNIHEMPTQRVEDMAKIPDVNTSKTLKTKLDTDREDSESNKANTNCDSIKDNTDENISSKINNGTDLQDALEKKFINEMNSSKNNVNNIEDLSKSLNVSTTNNLKNKSGIECTDGNDENSDTDCESIKNFGELIEETILSDPCNDDFNEKTTNKTDNSNDSIDLMTMQCAAEKSQDLDSQSAIHVSQLRHKSARTFYGKNDTDDEKSEDTDSEILKIKPNKKSKLIIESSDDETDAEAEKIELSSDAHKLHETSANSNSDSETDIEMNVSEEQCKPNQNKTSNLNDSDFIPATQEKRANIISNEKQHNNEQSDGFCSLGDSFRLQLTELTATENSNTPKLINDENVQLSDPIASKNDNEIRVSENKSETKNDDINNQTGTNNEDGLIKNDLCIENNENINNIHASRAVKDIPLNTNKLNAPDKLNEQLNNEDVKDICLHPTQKLNELESNSADNETSAPNEDIFLRPTQIVDRIDEDIYMQPTQKICSENIDRLQSSGEHIFLQPTQLIVSNKNYSSDDHEDDAFLQPTQIIVRSENADHISIEETNVYLQPTQLIENLKPKCDKTAEVESQLEVMFNSLNNFNVSNVSDRPLNPVAGMLSNFNSQSQTDTDEIISNSPNPNDVNELKTNSFVATAGSSSLCSVPNNIIALNNDIANNKTSEESKCISTANKKSAKINIECVRDSNGEEVQNVVKMVASTVTHNLNTNSCDSNDSNVLSHVDNKSGTNINVKSTKSLRKNKTKIESVLQNNKNYEAPSTSDLDCLDSVASTLNEIDSQKKQTVENENKTNNSIATSSTSHLCSVQDKVTELDKDSDKTSQTSKCNLSANKNSAKLDIECVGNKNEEVVQNADKMAADTVTRKLNKNSCDGSDTNLKEIFYSDNKSDAKSGVKKTRKSSRNNKNGTSNIHNNDNVLESADDGSNIETSNSISEGVKEKSKSKLLKNRKDEVTNNNVAQMKNQEKLGNNKTSRKKSTVSADDVKISIYSDSLVTRASSSNNSVPLTSSEASLGRPVNDISKIITKNSSINAPKDNKVLTKPLSTRQKSLLSTKQTITNDEEPQSVTEVKSFTRSNVSTCSTANDSVKVKGTRKNDNVNTPQVEVVLTKQVNIRRKRKLSTNRSSTNSDELNVTKAISLTNIGESDDEDDFQIALPIKKNRRGKTPTKDLVVSKTGKKQNAKASTSSKTNCEPLSDSLSSSSVNSRSRRTRGSQKEKFAPHLSSGSDSETSSPSNKTKRLKTELLNETALVSTPQRLKRKLKPKVAFTMFESPEMEMLIKRLGGSLVDSVNACTVLVTKSVVRTKKLLAAVGQGKPICSPKWLEECKRANEFLDPWNHIVKDEEAEKKWNFSLEVSLRRSLDKKLLPNYKFLLLVTTATDVLRDAIEACGGKCVAKAPPKSFSGQFIVISDYNKSENLKYKKSNVMIVAAEAIFDGVLRQELQFQKHLL